MKIVYELLDGKPILSNPILIEGDMDIPVNHVELDNSVSYTETGEMFTPSLQSVQDAKIAELNQACNEFTLSGFPSSALGVEHIYPSDAEAQVNLQGAIIDILIDPTVSIVSFKTLDAGYLDHTPEQIKQVGKDWKKALIVNLVKYNQMKAQIKAYNSANDIPTIMGIKW